MLSVQKPIDFYRERAQYFDQERKIFQYYVTMIQPSKKELHILDWESRQQEESRQVIDNSSEKLDLELLRLDREIVRAADELGDLKGELQYYYTVYEAGRQAGSPPPPL
jgi:hypothetical protein